MKKNVTALVLEFDAKASLLYKQTPENDEKWLFFSFLFFKYTYKIFYNTIYFYSYNHVVLETFAYVYCKYGVYKNRFAYFRFDKFNNINILFKYSTTIFFRKLLIFMY